MTKNVGDFNNIKLISKCCIYKNKNNNNENNNNHHQKLIWNNAPFNKNINTFESVFYKKTYDKYIPVRDKLIPDTKNASGGIILPNLKNINNSNNLNISNNNNWSNYHSINLKKSFNVNKNNLRSLSTDKAKLQQQQNININSMTNDTSAFTNSSKKYFSPPMIGNQNYTEELSNFRMGLLSAGSTSNNNVIIPMIPMRRPVSNFNFCGGQIWNNLENKNINHNIIDNHIIKTDDNNNIITNKNNNNININKKEKENDLNLNDNNNKINNKNEKNNFFIKANGYSRNKSMKAQEMRGPINSLSINHDVNNYYLGMDKMINKLHKIKIEKGMMNPGIMTNFNKNINSDYHSQIEQFKKSHLPMMFNNNNNQNQNNKKNINSNNNNNKDNNKRSYSTTNKNKIY